MTNNNKFRLAAGIFLAAAIFGATTTLAKVYAISGSDPVAAVEVPDDWKPTDIDNGIEMQSPDGDIYVAIESVKADNITDVVAESVKVLAKQGLVIDKASKKIKDYEANGMKIHDIDYSGEDKDGSTEFALTLVETPDPEKFVMLTFWGSKEAQKTNDAAIGSIMQSLKLTK